MSYYGSAVAATNSDTEPAAPGGPTLDLAVTLDTGLSVTTSTDVTLDAGVSVSTGDYLVAIFGSRHTNTGRDHLSMTPDVWSCTFTKIIDQQQVDATFSTATRLSIWTGIASSSGTGNLTAVTTANTFQRGLILLRVPGGNSVAQTAVGSSSTGTGNSVAWSATPNAAGLSIGCGVYQANPSPALADHAAIAGALLDQNGNILMNAWQKLLSPPDPLVFSGATNDQTRVVGALNILGV